MVPEGGDNVRIQDLSTTQRQILLGSMFGDGGCILPKNGVHALYMGAKREQDKDYLLWKLHSFVDTGLFRQGDLKFCNKGVYIRTRSCDIATELYNMFYPGGRKHISAGLLDMLEPLGAAVWYMDDGNLSKDKHVIISTEEYTQDENIMMRRWFLHLGINFGIYPKRLRGKVYFRLIATNKVNSLLFLRVVRPYCVSCMERKFY